MAASNKASAAKARMAAAQTKALELRRAGHSYAKIGEALGVSGAMAHRYVKEALAEALAYVKADANELRAEEVSRLDSLLNALWVKARKGDVVVIDRVLKIMERRAKLLGLDMPQRIAVGGDSNGAPLTMQQMIELTDEALERIATGRSA